MNKIRKSLGLLLAIALILNLFSVSAFAAVKEGYLMSERLRLPDGAPTTVSAGDTVRFELTLESKSEFPNWYGGEFDIGYDSSVFEFAQTVGAFQNGILSGYAYDGKVNTTNSYFSASASLPTSDEVSAYAWDALMHICLVLDDSTPVNVSTETKILAFEMKVKEGVADGTYTVGIGKAGFDEMSCYVNESLNGSAYHGFAAGTSYGLADDDAPLYDVSESYVTFTVGASGPSVTTGDVKAQWANKAEGKMNLGFKGTISGAALTFVGATDEIETGLYQVGMVSSSTDATPTIAEGAQVSLCDTLYVEGDNYVFRAVMNDVDYSHTGTFYVNTFIITADGADPIYGVPIETSVNAEYTAAVARGLDPIA